MRRIIAAATTALVTLSPAFAQAPKAEPPKAAPKIEVVKAAKPTRAPTDANMIIRESQNSVKESLDKLATAAEAKGAKVVARVDHAKGAAAVGATMKPSEVLILGNAKLGTPPMLANPRMGLDLPLKVLAYEDAAGKVWLVYPKPSSLQARYKLKAKDQAANFKAIADALDGLTTAAATK